MAEAFRMDSPAEQAERRRKQLIAVVAHLVVTRGVAEVSHASVAKVAGCARSLVYRYFPRQEDLLYSLLSGFSENLGARMTLAEESAGVLGLAAVRPGSIPLADPAAVRPDVAARRLGAAAARVPAGVHHPHAATPACDRCSEPTTRSCRPPWRAIWRIHCARSACARSRIAIFIDSMLSVMDHVIRAAWVGEIDHDEAAQLSAAVNSRVLQTFVKSSDWAQFVMPLTICHPLR